MKLLLATNHLGLGGSESYLLTVAEQLDRLAHEVRIYSPDLGNGTDAARERGLSLLTRLEAEPFDAAIVQDAGVSHEVADAYPGTPQLFVAHSETYDLQAPPQLPGIVAAAVALNDRVADRLHAFATEVEVVRLRQPIDIERFASAGPLPERPRRALAVSNNPNQDRLAILRSACEGAGMELATLGGQGNQSADPRSPLAEADVVIGYGRSILEAMACGRAAYVYDWYGGDGWVTPESYPRIEADGIAGRRGETTIDSARLAEDLRGYDPALGPAGRDLVIAHHRANVHAQELVGLLERIASPEAPPRGPLEEMARLVRLEWRARDEVRTLRRENIRLRETQRRMQEATDEVMRQLRESEEERHRLLTSTSWRLTRPLRNLLERRRR